MPGRKLILLTARRGAAASSNGSYTATFVFDNPQPGDETNWPAVTIGGTPYLAKISAVGPTAGTVYIDIQSSMDLGATWHSIFPGGTANVLVLPAGVHTGPNVTLSSPICLSRRPTY